MGIDRRDFLKVAGLSTIVGLGGAGAFELLKPGTLDASSGHAPKEAAHGAEAEAKAVPVGKRYGMVVDMSKKEDWQACIDACHLTHNVPSIENPKEEIKWIWRDKFGHVFPSKEHEFMREEWEKIPFILLCNHCENPPCVRVCPTKATFKRDDGIVMMDMHRCIGCRFCMAGCPYGARSFNWRDPRPFIKELNHDYPTRERGVVEKCTFCTERLAVGKLPACVEACKHGGLVFGDLHDPNSEIRKILRTKSTIRRKPEAGTNPSVFFVV